MIGLDYYNTKRGLRNKESYLLWTWKAVEIKQEIEIGDVKLEYGEPNFRIGDPYNRMENGEVRIKNWDNSDWIQRVEVAATTIKSETYVDEKHFVNRIEDNREIKEESQYELNIDMKEYMNVTELTEELDIKNESDADTLDEEGSSAVAEDTREIQHQPVNMKTARKLFKCYYCKYTTHHICGNSRSTKTNTKNVQPTNISTHSDSLSTASTSLQCNAVFTSMVALDDHMLKKHHDCNPIISRKIHSCTQCPYQTTMKSKFIAHMPNHSETVQFSLYRHCRHCKATFKSKIALDDHIIKKHPKFIETLSCKVHECTKCTFKTAQKTHLVRHFLKHGGVG